jgi:hypothetical protein
MEESSMTQKQEQARSLLEATLSSLSETETRNQQLCHDQVGLSCYHLSDASSPIPNKYRVNSKKICMSANSW